MKSQIIITLPLKPGVLFFKYIPSSQRLFLKFYKPMYLEHINSISRLFQELVSIFLGNKYMWLKHNLKKESPVRLKTRIWFLNALKNSFSSHIKGVTVASWLRSCLRFGSLNPKPILGQHCKSSLCLLIMGDC